MSDSLRKKLAIACNAYIVLSVAYGIAYKITEMGVGETLEYYTYWANIFAAVVGVAFLLVVLCNKRGRAAHIVFLLRFLATCCLTITFCVVVFVLSPYPESGGLMELIFLPVRFSTHLTNPLLSALSFFVFERWDGWGRRLELRDAVISLIPSCLYAAVLYPLNALALVWGPYPFFAVFEMPLWQTLLWFVGLVVVFFLIALLIRWVRNKTA